MKDIVTEDKYLEILSLQDRLNTELRSFFQKNKDKGREKLATILVVKVDKIIDELNKEGYNFGSCDYGGDINYENSEQSFCDGKEMGTGICLHFHGFSVQAFWEGSDKYA